MITIEGKCGIKATIICDSISEIGNRLTTYEISYPRIILAEANTHRMLAKNSSSSRAIPFAKMLDSLTGRPVRFGKNVSGMQDSGEHDALITGKEFNDATNCTTYAYTPEQAWEEAKKDAIFWAKAFSEAGYHKQVVNRLLEPFQMMKTVISGTEWENFFWLRNHSAADPTFEELARCMKEAREVSIPQLLKAGQWHLPYISMLVSTEGDNIYYYLSDDDIGTTGYIPLEDAIKVSCARTCAVSFRNIDYGLEKSREVYNRLVSDEKIHGSALEHAATPMRECDEEINSPSFPDSWEQGISHMDREGNLWSGNLKGFIQYRKLIPGENYTGQKNG